MPSQESFHQATLKQLLDDLISQQHGLVEQLSEQTSFPLYVQDTPAEQARRHLNEHICQLEYQDNEMKGGQTVSFQGVCGTNQQSLDLLDLINEQRKRLHKHLMLMDKLMVRDDGHEPIRLSTYALQQLGYARFNRRQAVRRFNVFNQNMLSVSFFWASQRKIKKASVGQVRDDLNKKMKTANPDFRYYLEADLVHLNALDSREDLYYVYLKNDNPRANYTLETKEGIKRGSCMASNPFFFIAKEHAPLPRVRDLPLLSQRAPRLTRTDKTIDDTPYLASVHVHRLLSASQ